MAPQQDEPNREVAADPPIPAAEPTTPSQEPMAPPAATAPANGDAPAAEPEPAGDVTTAFGEQTLIAIGEGARAGLSAYDYILTHGEKRTKRTA